MVARVTTCLNMPNIVTTQTLHSQPLTAGKTRAGKTRELNGYLQCIASIDCRLYVCSLLDCDNLKNVLIMNVK